LTDVTGKPHKVVKGGARQGLFSLLATACLDMPATVVVSSILINLLALFMPLAIMQVYDRIIPRQAVETLTVLVIVIALAIASEAIFRIARNHVVSWSATTLAWRTHHEVLKRVMAAPSSFLEAESASRNLDRIQALTAYAEWHGSPSRLVLADLPFVALYVGLMIIVGGQLAAIPLILFLVLAVAAHRRSTGVRKTNENRAFEDMKTRDFLIEAINGLPTIKAGAMENQMQRRFERLQETLAGHSFTSMRLAEETQAFGNLLSGLTQMMTVTVGAVLVINGTLSIGALACCVLLAGRAVQPLLRCVAVWNELQSVIVGVEKAGPLLKLPPVREGQHPAWTNGPMDIQFAGVSFHYDQDSRRILDRVTMTVPAGGILAITGRDGAGKSTLADLICGYLPNYTGEIRVGGFDPRSDGATLKQYLALVRPGASMMRGTIMDNLIMFRKGDEIELAIHAARLIGLDAQISKLPLGYQTVMSEGPSTELPTGLVQRIAIARAIARRPAVMVLDEANGALDVGSDQLLASGLRRLKGFTTIVIITNRPSFAAVADETWRLEAGKFEVVPPVSAKPVPSAATQATP
jgi:ATP-binding cassette, subfamily C, bacterial LapB